MAAIVSGMGKKRLNYKALIFIKDNGLDSGAWARLRPSWSCGRGRRPIP